MRSVIVRRTNAIIVLVEIRAFATGCVLELDFVVRPVKSDQDGTNGWFRHELIGGGPRVGVLFADGRKALNGEHVLTPEAAPDPPILRSYVGAGFHISPEYARLRDQLWLWPLPPAEPFDLVVGWPGVDIPEVGLELDGAAIVKTAGQAEPYWVAGS